MELVKVLVALDHLYVANAHFTCLRREVFMMGSGVAAVVKHRNRKRSCGYTRPPKG